MSLPLSPATLEAAYDFLRTTLPFRRWKLPAGEQIEFHVTGHVNRRGHCLQKATHHVVAISGATIGQTHSLMMAMAHEMVHVHLDRKAVKAAHGADFHRCADLVCKYHGFDRKLF